MYLAGFGLGFATSPLEGTTAIVAAFAVRIAVAILAAFATAFVSILWADMVVDRPTPKGSATATLRVHAKELVTAGLLSVVIAFPLDFTVLPYATLILIGPPIVAQVISLEYRSFSGATTRAGELLRGQWARVALVVLVFVFIAWLVLFMFAYALPLIMSFYSAGMLALYLDVRARAEELDLESFAAERELAMGERPATDPNQD